MNRFINILQFLTRIKIKDIGYDPNMGKGIVYFPIVGAIIGIIMVAIAKVISFLLDSAQLSVLISILVLLTEVVLTGGLHLDGFADTFDGIFSYRKRDEILEIMKDSRVGTNALLAVIFLILIKVAILNFFISRNIFWPIFSMPVIGRFTCVVLSYKTVPAKPSGMGNIFIGKADIGTLIMDTVITLLCIIIPSLVATGSFIISVVSGIAVFAVYMFSAFFEIGVYKKIGGLTGDILGCGIEIGELIFLMYILIVLVN